MLSPAVPFEKLGHAGQIDTRWTGAIAAGFTGWLRENTGKLSVAREQVEEILKGRAR